MVRLQYGGLKSVLREKIYAPADSTDNAEAAHTLQQWAAFCRLTRSLRTESPTILVALSRGRSPRILEFPSGRQTRLHALNLHHIAMEFKLRKALDK